MHTQPRFTVVTFVLVALVGLGFLSKLLQPYIVAPTNHRLANAEATFLQSGAHEHVAWYPVADVSFQEARRLDRPILLFVGAPWSQTARRMDAVVFTSIPVQKLLDRNFICIRADAVETPDWMSAFLPISRAQLTLAGDFQIWILDSQARLFTSVAAKAEDPGYQDTQFMDEVLADLSKLQDARQAEGDSTGNEAGALQSADLARLSGPTLDLVPNLPIYRDDLMNSQAASPIGGFVLGGRQRLWPDAWSFLLASSGPTAVVPAVDNLLKSPTRDMLDGGFFFGSRDATWNLPMYDKVATLNAELCLLLAQLSVTSPGATPYDRFADDAFDALTIDFLNSDGVIRPCRIGDERPNAFRSQHSSFNPRQVRSLLDGDDRGYAQEVLHLRPATNPQMTPFLTDFSEMGNPLYGRVVSELKGFGPSPTYDHEATLATFGASIARLLQSARIMNDPARLQRAHDIAGHIDLFRRNADVLHELAPIDRARPTVTDYLAFADAALQDFLTSSRVESLENGAAVLKRGLDRFGISDEACYRMAILDSPHRVAPGSNTPQICDDTGESANAAMIRLAWSYARLLDHSSSLDDRRLAAFFRTKATANITQFADIATGLGPYTGGYASAVALATDDTIILCSGPDPATMANALAPKSPFRLVCPIAGPVYPGLIRKPGYYVSLHGHLTGPMTVAAALKMLPPTLFIGG